MLLNFLFTVGLLVYLIYLCKRDNLELIVSECSNIPAHDQSTCYDVISRALHHARTYWYPVATKRVWLIYVYINYNAHAYWY